MKYKFFLYIGLVNIICAIVVFVNSIISSFVYDVHFFYVLISLIVSILNFIVGGTMLTVYLLEDDEDALLSDGASNMD